MDLLALALSWFAGLTGVSIASEPVTEKAATAQETPPISGVDIDASKPAASGSAPDLFNEPLAGYSMRIPQGYERLSEDENREVFRGLSEYLGKEVGDRVLRRPPTWFKGPINPKRPKEKPPALAVGYTDLDEPIDPAQMSRYKSDLEQEYRKRGDKYGEIKIDLVTVGGVNSLRVEHDIFSPIDNSRSRMIKVVVPGHGGSYDIVFNFSGDQASDVATALETVLSSFNVQTRPVVDQETTSRWTRVALWTGGCFLIGILLSVLLKMLAGVGEKTSKKS